MSSSGIVLKHTDDGYENVPGGSDQFDDRSGRVNGRDRVGTGTLTYEGTFLTESLQREVIRDVLKRAGLTWARIRICPQL